MTLEIQVLAEDRHKHVAVLNRLMWLQHFLSLVIKLNPLATLEIQDIEDNMSQKHICNLTTNCLKNNTAPH
jgi:hypothetical protein